MTHFGQEKETFLAQTSAEKEQLNEANSALQRDRDEQLMAAENEKQEVIRISSLSSQWLLLLISFLLSNDIDNHVQWNHSPHLVIYNCYNASI